MVKEQIKGNFNLCTAKCQHIGLISHSLKRINNLHSKKPNANTGKHPLPDKSCLPRVKRAQATPWFPWIKFTRRKLTEQYRVFQNPPLGKTLPEHTNKNSVKTKPRGYEESEQDNHNPEQTNQKNTKETEGKLNRTVIGELRVYTEKEPFIRIARQLKWSYDN